MKGRKRRNAIGAAFSARRVDMLESPAWRALSLSAHRVIDRIAIEHCQHGGADNGRLPVTFDDFERYGIHRHAIAPAIREAEALGFIETTVKGRAGNSEWRAPSQYRLTFAASDHRIGDGTHEWMSIRENEAEAIAMAARRPRKIKTPVVENASSQCGNHHQEPQFSSAETATTGTGTETTTTFYISGGDAA